jgi:hypothetical protein
MKYINKNYRIIDSKGDGNYLYRAVLIALAIVKIIT